MVIQHTCDILRFRPVVSVWTKFASQLLDTLLPERRVRQPTFIIRAIMFAKQMICMKDPVLLVHINEPHTFHCRLHPNSLVFISDQYMR